MVSFSKTLTLKSNVLDLVYSYVCGPMDVDSLGSNKFFVIIIDDAYMKA